jgi:hypothetical protein
LVAEAMRNHKPARTYAGQRHSPGLRVLRFGKLGELSACLSNREVGHYLHESKVPEGEALSRKNSERTSSLNKSPVCGRLSAWRR